MASTRDLVNRIRELLAAGGEVQREGLAQLVWEYDGECRRVTEKSEACLDLLRQGRRAEAVRLAAEGPDLQQDILALDFAERADWLDLCERAALPVSESFNAAALYSVAQELYAESGALDRLLAIHRRMALGGAPLADRLRVLRLIRKVDPRDRDWDEDIRAYEKAAVEELAGRAEAAHAAGDLETLEEVLARLEAGSWAAAPAPGVVRAVEQLAAPLRARAARERYQALLEELHEAHSALDGPRVAGLLVRWQDVADETGVAPDADLAAAAQPARDWLQQSEAQAVEEAGYGRALASLEAAVNQSAGREELERLAAGLLRFGRGMPDGLRARYAARLAAAERREKRRWALRVAVVTGSVLVAAAGLTFVAAWRIGEHQASALAGAIRADIAGARARWSETDAEAAEEEASVRADALAPASPRAIEMRRLAREARALADEIAAQKRRFGQRMDALDEHVGRIEAEESGDAAGEGVARVLELSRRTKRLDALARGLGEQLGACAADTRTDAQRAAVEAARARLAALVASSTDRLAEAFSDQTARLQDAYGAFQAERGPARDHETVLGRLERGESLLAGARALAGIEGAAGPGKARVESLSARLAADVGGLQEALGAFRDRETMLKQIAWDYGRPDRLASDLAAYAKRFAADPLSRDFERLAAMGGAWEAVAAWHALRSAWGEGVRVGEGTDVAARVVEVEAYLSAHAVGPHHGAAETYLEYLRTASAALKDGRVKDLATTMGLLGGPVVANLKVVRTRDGRAFYLRGERDFRPQYTGGELVGYQVTHIVDGALTTRNTLLVADDVASGPETAPQSMFAAAAEERILKASAYAWETFYLLLADLVLETDGLDPILAASLLKLHLLPEACATTPGSPARLTEVSAMLANVDLLDVPWMDPESDDANDIRPRMGRILRGVGRLSPVADEVERRLDGMAEAMTSYRPAGILMGDEGGVRLDPAVRRATVYVLWPGGPGAEFRKVGGVEDGVFEAVGTGASLYPVGTPLFARTR